MNGRKFLTRVRLKPLLVLGVALPLAAGQLAGCARNPATGGSVFTGGLSQAEEIQMGRENHPKILQEFNGAYAYRDLDRYVDGIGQRLARISERNDLKFTFTVLNSDIVNAFATPGGYIYVSRGLLALADNEAQLAGVLAHEIGHITALHHAQRQGDALLANIGVLAAGVLGGRAAAQAGQLGAVSLLQSFSRENEYEADLLGVRYLARTGYDPGAMAAFLAKLRAESRLTMIRRGESPDKVDEFNYLATHPAPAARVDRAAGLAREAAVATPKTGREEYLSRIDGMLYGDDPSQGFLLGRDFVHPALRFGFEVPRGFSLFNTSDAVLAIGPDKARIVFDRADKPFTGSMEAYLRSAWAPGRRLGAVETIRVNGMEAATATTTAQTPDGTFDARLVAYRFDAENVYRFVFLTPRAMTAALALDLRRTTYSFRRLSVAEAARLKPLVLRIVTVRPGDTVESLSQRMAFDDYRLERFEVLNGLSRNDRLTPGQTVKIVAAN